MTGFPCRYVVFDTESRDRRPSTEPGSRELHLRLGVAWIVDRELDRAAPIRPVRFHTADEFHAAVASMPRSDVPITILAHNIGFDLRMVGFLRHLADGRYHLTPPSGTKAHIKWREPLFICESPPVIIRMWRDDGQRLLLLDTFQWLPYSLASVGDKIGLPKFAAPEVDAPDEDWFVYCDRDVAVLHAALDRLWSWLRSIGCRDWEPTIASQARRLFTMRYERKSIQYPVDPASQALDRIGYYGGRTDVFRTGRTEGPIYHVDINSMYPYMMSVNEYPVEVTHLDHSRTASLAVSDVDADHTTAEVWIESDRECWPVRSLNGTIHCAGRVRTVLCGPELRRAIDSGKVKRVGRYTRYRTARIFHRWVSDLYHRRREAERDGDQMSASLAKSLLNSLYGKFGQRGGDWQPHSDGWGRGLFAGGKIVGINDDADVDCRILNGHLFTKTKGEEPPRSFAAISAWCCSYARVYMDAMRAHAGERNVLYQGVDSLLLTYEGIDNIMGMDLLHDDRIGMFKPVNQYKWVDISDCNNWESDLTRKVSGVKAGSRWVGHDVVITEDWESLSRSIFGGRVSSVFIRQITRHIHPTHWRRRTNADGWTDPLVIDNWDVSPEEQSRLRWDGTSRDGP